MELIVRLHRWARDQKLDYRIVFQPDPVCWTEVPESLKVLKRQRNRWQRGSIETFWMHRDMLCRPKYGVLGMVAFPFFVLFETLGPLVELAGYGLTALGLLWRIFDLEVVYLFFLAAVLYGMLLSVASVILEELSTKRYPKVKNLCLLIVAGLVENLGFRQLLTFWRALAFLDVIRGNKTWGAMERQGLQRRAAEAEDSVDEAMAIKG
jgi:cellulose synthase/poly-beta-1,6-N-acetylglucosamine synthase-like glycosyltransferase